MKTEAAKYDRNNALQVRDAKLLIERIKLEYPEYESWSKKDKFTILDIGCGSGNVTELLFDAFQPARLIGIDCSQTMIDYAVKHHSKNSAIEYYVADCTMNGESLSQTVDLIAGTVDLIVSIYCLHWVTNVGDALQNVRSFLRPNTGRFALLISVWSDLFPVQHRIIDHPEWRQKLQQWIDDRSREQNGTQQTPTRPQTLTAFGVQNKPEVPIVEARWRSLIQKADLNIENITFTNVNYHYPTVDRFHDQVEIVSYWFGIVPEPFQDRFRGDYFRLIDREYVKQNTDSVTNSIKFNYTYSTIIGTNNQA